MLYLAHFSFRQEKSGGYFTVVLEASDDSEALDRASVLAYKRAKDFKYLRVVYLEEITEIIKMPEDGFVSYVGHYPDDIYADLDPETNKEICDDKPLLIDLIFPESIKDLYRLVVKKASKQISKLTRWISNNVSMIYDIRFEILYYLNLIKDGIIMSSVDKSKKPGKIVCVMATYKRETITEETLKMLKKQSVPIDVVVVGSSSSDKEVAKKCGCIYVNHDNKPLSQKWQAGIDKSRELSPDAVMVCGSDSWLSSNWCELIYPYTTKFDLVGVNNFYACKAYPKEKMKIIHRRYKGSRRNFPVGSGRMFSKKILDKVNWNIYPGSKNSGLDAQSYNVIKTNGGSIKSLNDKNLKVLAIKSVWESLNPWKKYIRSNKNIQEPDIENPKEWLSTNFTGSVEALNRIVKNLEW